MHETLRICGTTSAAGKSTVTTGLCRLLARRGVAVAERQIDRIADACAEHLDTDRLWQLVEEGLLSPRARPA